MKYDDFEEKYYIEMQKYKHFDRKNFIKVEKFTKIAYSIFKFILVIFFLICIAIVIWAIFIFLLMTVFNQRQLFSF